MHPRTPKATEATCATPGQYPPSSVQPRPLRSSPFRGLSYPIVAVLSAPHQIGSTLLAQAAGVPTLPWSGSHVAVSVSECSGGVIPPATYADACIAGVEEAVEACRAVGYPVMLKASWGGGGKGIRKVGGGGGRAR